MYDIQAEEEPRYMGITPKLVAIWGYLLTLLAIIRYIILIKASRRQ